MQLMFNTCKHSDGLTYVEPLPSGHWMYAARDFVVRLGRAMDRLVGMP